MPPFPRRLARWKAGVNAQDQSQTKPLRLSRLAGSGSPLGSETSPVTSAASRIWSPSTSRTSLPGCTRSPLTKVPLVDPSSRIVARPPSSTRTVALPPRHVVVLAKRGGNQRLRRVPAKDDGGSRGDVRRSPWGTRSAAPGPGTGDAALPGSGCRHWRQTTSAGSCAGVPQFGQIALLSPGRMYCCDTVGDGMSSSGYGACGKLAPHRKQIRSSGCTPMPQFWQVRIAISSLSGGKPLPDTIPPEWRLAQLSAGGTALSRSPGAAHLGQGRAASVAACRFPHHHVPGRGSLPCA